MLWEVGVACESLYPTTERKVTNAKLAKLIRSQTPFDKSEPTTTKMKRGGQRWFNGYFEQCLRLGFQRRGEFEGKVSYSSKLAAGGTRWLKST